MLKSSATQPDKFATFYKDTDIKESKITPALGTNLVMQWHGKSKQSAGPCHNGMGVSWLPGRCQTDSLERHRLELPMGIEGSCSLFFLILTCLLQPQAQTGTGPDHGTLPSPPSTAIQPEISAAFNKPLTKAQEAHTHSLHHAWSHRLLEAPHSHGRGDLCAGGSVHPLSLKLTFKYNFLIHEPLTCSSAWCGLSGETS